MLDCRLGKAALKSANGTIGRLSKRKPVRAAVAMSHRGLCLG